ncbi:MAG: hypothetical protein M0R30_08675 [Methanoregula sp.]|uniref:hypothetical protein n=1 Tax=Methanoregula sp. TaxID=2052170 RepID=UPI0025DFB27D|nr:hypothetical protein [Methanoregula sp.]MCK9631705.1 hypothetical protein [Methanoregula sp.]
MVPERNRWLEKNASAFFDFFSTLRRILMDSSHPHGSDEPFGSRCVGTAKMHSHLLETPLACGNGGLPPVAMTQALPE